MTPADYWKQVSEACDKATPGPWTDGNYPDITTEDGCTAVLNSEMGFVLADDAEFIALSRTALPLALARIEELEAALEQISDSSVASLEATELTAIARAALGRP